MVNVGRDTDASHIRRIRRESKAYGQYGMVVTVSGIGCHHHTVTGDGEDRMLISSITVTANTGHNIYHWLSHRPLSAANTTGRIVV